MNLEVRQTPKGRGVFATEHIPKLTWVLEYRGRLYPYEEIARTLPPGEDFYLQITPDWFIGPSGDIDDLVNHSCEPNCGIVVIELRAHIVTLQDIEPGEELTYDYSVTSTEDESTWTMKCLCGAERCRGVITGRGR